MLSEREIQERAKYCYCVFRQLSWLDANPSIPPSLYMRYLGKSSLDLIHDEFITMSLEEAIKLGNVEEGLRSLMILYEGFMEAFCAVLETDLAGIEKEVDPEYLRRLAAEVDWVFREEKTA